MARSGMEILLSSLGLNPKEIENAMKGVIGNIEAMRGFMLSIDQRLGAQQLQLDRIEAILKPYQLLISSAHGTLENGHAAASQTDENNVTE